jgi:hypothetical protein
LPNERIRYKGRSLRLKKATVKPAFGGRTVLVADPWDYVDLWLRRERHDRARFYWEQARNFASAAAALPATSAPLLAYYAMLNCAKTLLTVQNCVFSEKHGIGGRRREASRGLKAEVVKLTNGGVFGPLSQLLGEPVAKNEECDLKGLLYNLVWVHRAFSLTYRSTPELFVPLQDVYFARRVGSTEAWFECTVSPGDITYLSSRRLPAGYEWADAGASGLTLRRNARFTWSEDDEEGSLDRLAKYHRTTRAGLS